MNTIVITGATSGIGLETARILARQGFRILGIGHSEKNCTRAKENLLTENPDAKITFFIADLMQQREILRVAEELTTYLCLNCGGELYALINNAGCARNWYMTTDEGYEQQFALNYLAGFLLTYELLPLLQKANGRVIMTGSESHKGIRVHWNDVMLRRGYNPLTAYKQSKLCDILFAKGLNDRYAASGLHAYVVDPGLVHTDIGNKAAGGLVGLVWTLRKRCGIEPSVPAQTYAYLCDPAHTLQGLYYHLLEENPFSKEVTSENADRLFALSERLCEVQYARNERGAIA
ncbi:MAG: SDR family NAD(P)-dependent oxidoreductase [Oscillospiraceae bacterium]|nr:SDR family NAD(P)-dependent oxidoreductase [Oscillospiraceae bacterium]